MNVCANLHTSPEHDRPADIAINQQIKSWWKYTVHKHLWQCRQTGRELWLVSSSLLRLEDTTWLAPKRVKRKQRHWWEQDEIDTKLYSKQRERSGQRSTWHIGFIYDDNLVFLQKSGWKASIIECEHGLFWCVLAFMDNLNGTSPCSRTPLIPRYRCFSFNCDEFLARLGLDITRSIYQIYCT